MSSATSPVTGDQLDAPDDRRWLILIVVAVAQLMVVLDGNASHLTRQTAARKQATPEPYGYRGRRVFGVG